MHDVTFFDLQDSTMTKNFFERLRDFEISG